MLQNQSLFSHFASLELGTVDNNPPQDLNGSFEPELIPKRHKNLGEDLNRQIIVLYPRGANYSDIREHLLDMYSLPGGFCSYH